MAGLGLTNAVQMYAQGADWRQRTDARAKDEAFQQGQRERLVKRQAVEDQQFDIEQEARTVGEKAYKDAMTGFQQQAGGPSLGDAGAAGAQPGLQPAQPAQPDPAQMRDWNKQAVLRSLEARSDFYAGRGDVQGFMKNEAAAMPYRSEVRTQTIDRALQQYGADKDPVALAKSVHGVLFDGLDITDAKQEQGGKVTLTLSNGKTQSLSPDKLVQAAQYMRDPKAAAEYEAKTRWELMKAQIETNAKNDQADHKGSVDAGLEAVKHGNAVALEGVRGRNELQQIGARTAGDIKVAETRGAQDRLTNKEKPTKTHEEKRLRSDALQRLVINSGIGTPDPVTGQARGNADSNRVALRAEQWLDQYPEMSELEAINKAVGEFNARKKQ